jgi:hypothetical protein
MTYETQYDERTGRLVEPAAGWETVIADARRALDEAYWTGRSGGVADGEQAAIVAARDAARDGMRGAYPLPPVYGVDDWWCSGPRFAMQVPPAVRDDEDGWW